MINETIKKINEARLKVSLDYNEMIDVKKYMFKEILKLKTTDEEVINKDCEYVNSLNTLNPDKIDETKISSLGAEIMYMIFGGYISIVSSKRCEEDFTIDKAVYENENDYQQYGCNVMKRMFLKYKAQTIPEMQEETVQMIRNQFDAMAKFTENLFAFKLSDNRCLLLVNSFFRLYFDNYADKKLFMDLDISKFSNIPSYSAITPNTTIFTENRRYKYDIHEIDLDTVDYINSLC